MSEHPDRLAHFAIEGTLGAGGQSVVYRAVDTSLNRAVALKVFSRGFGPNGGVLRRFRREASCAGRLDHPGICAVHETGLEGGAPYIAMQLVEGRTLAEIIRTDGSIEPMEAASLMEGVTRAAHVAHETGIVHRDLKPRNIMVTPAGKPIILDFGMARDEASDLITITLRHELAGTPAYMAPEQVDPRGRRPDRRTDVYAMGATLYECLAGRPPFDAPTREGLYRVILDRPARPLGVRVPRDLEVIVDTALCKEPDRRYRTALAMAEDLRRLREHEPILARRAGPLLRYRRWLRRRPALAGGVTLLAVMLVVALAGTSWLLHRARISLGQTQRVADMQALPFLLQVFETEHWPATPQGIPAMNRWLAEAESMYGRLDRYETEMRGDPEPAAALVQFVGELTAFGETIEGVRRRRADAAVIEQHSLDAYAGRWRWAIDAIADAHANPQYAGLRIDPQVGLVPVGQDPVSGLFEFAHLQTGEIPARDATTGTLRMTEHCGLVFVLVPGGAFDMGSEPPSEERPIGTPNVDPHRTLDEAEHPVHRVELSPFFISKFEMTQAQWVRVTGVNPSSYQPGVYPRSIPWYTPLMPVESLDWQDANAALLHLGLRLPTEAQWEYAARGRTTTIWWTGDDAESIRWSSNLDDRAEYPAPVGTYPANPFGLHEVSGNVLELVQDYFGSYSDPVRSGDGERIVETGLQRVARGGTFGMSELFARSASRSTTSQAGKGVRPARRVTKWPYRFNGVNGTPPPTATAQSPWRTNLTIGGSVTISLDPRATYLRTAWKDDWSPPAIPIPLAELGVHAGDRIELRRLGDHRRLGDDAAYYSLSAVFSGSDVLLPRQHRHRAPDAIKAATDLQSQPARNGGLATDIPEDFAVADRLGIENGVSVVVPVGATHLFFSTCYAFFEEWYDADSNFGVRITLERRAAGAGPPDDEKAPGHDGRGSP